MTVAHSSRFVSEFQINIFRQCCGAVNISFGLRGALNRNYGSSFVPGSSFSIDMINKCKNVNYYLVLLGIYFRILQQPKLFYRKNFFKSLM